MNRYRRQIVRRTAGVVALIGGMVAAGFFTYNYQLSKAKAKAAAELNGGCDFVYACGQIETRNVWLYTFLAVWMVVAIVVLVGLLGSYIFGGPNCVKESCPCINHRQSTRPQWRALWTVTAIAAAAVITSIAMAAATIAGS